MLPITQKYETPKRKHRNNNIPSYGLILFYIDKELQKVKFLVQQRRDTFDYVEFVQGLWNTEERFKALIPSMSGEEKNRLITYSFREIWDDLWIDKTSRMYKDGYNRALKKYESISHLIKPLVLSSNSETVSPPWGFPKGRKNDLSEKDEDCAIRETEEETRISKSGYDILDYKFLEKFQGSNGASYSTTYFLCKLENCDIPEKIDTPLYIRKTSLSDEVAEIKWVTYEEADIYLNVRRISLLCGALETINKHFNL